MGLWHGLVIGVGGVALCGASAWLLDRIGTALFTTPEEAEGGLPEEIVAA